MCSVWFACVLFGLVTSRSSGPVLSQCESMTPGHGASSQTSAILW